MSCSSEKIEVWVCSGVGFEYERGGLGGVVNDIVFFFFKQKTAYEMLRSLVGSEMCNKRQVWAH